MSIDRCLEIIEVRFDREQDAETLVEELAELESESLAEGDREKYHEPLSSFLGRADELLSEEELNESLLVAAIANFRTDLENLKASQVVDLWGYPLSGRSYFIAFKQDIKNLFQ